MQLQKQRLEAESKKEEPSKKQHQDVANAAAAVSNYHETSRKTKLSHGRFCSVQDECSFQQFQAYVC